MQVRFGEERRGNSFDYAPSLTLLRLLHGFVYLVAIMDWYSRKVLSWRISNTMEAEFCVACLEEALQRYGAPEIFNTDKAASSPLRPLQACFRRMMYGSVWMAAAGPWTTYLWNGSGAA